MSPNTCYPCLRSIHSRKGRGEVGFFVIVDPDGLLQWLGRNRALVAIRDAADLAARGLALQALRRDWIRAMP